MYMRREIQNIQLTKRPLITTRSNKLRRSFTGYK